MSRYDDSYDEWEDKKPKQQTSWLPSFKGMDTKSMGQVASQGGGSSKGGQVGGMLMASGNPAAMAGGAGLMALGAVAKAKKAEKQAEYQARLQRQQRQQSAINNMITVAQGIRNL